ncbi:hypothetical protein N0V88_007438 [Collariella sp. IMI 366227]|nr:hypothetical protein N0V88_007438 [Collariella sp. IMI 366227]
MHDTPPNPNDPNPNQQRQTALCNLPTGHAAHPDEILASCRALHEHVAQLLARSQQDLEEVEERIRARELAEKI